MTVKGRRRRWLLPWKGGWIRFIVVRAPMEYGVRKGRGMRVGRVPGRQKRRQSDYRKPLDNKTRKRSSRGPSSSGPHPQPGPSGGAGDGKKTSSEVII